MAQHIRPLMTPPTIAWAELPAHERDSAGVCLYCEDTPIWATYEEYTDHFWANEYEGAPGHAPNTREEFEYLRDSCLGV